ncbi:ATP-binding protein [Pedobacter yulinensis]|uniref:ATP-binding protein n=1 Tax=Pedobacter yulinensis TaxID=2126353 RepID=A0A2T3HL78_9SPHI|nr:ATP-binding protein [Pedobacter yulinensis]PST83184.1 ATP-binding protein [Pedobacter yulinensis]
MSSQKSKISETLLRESIFIIGTVSSVEGRKIRVKVKKDKNLSHLSYRGRTIKNVSVGSYIKITKGFIEIIGKVEGEYIKEETVYNREYKKDELKISRFLEVSLFGHFSKKEDRFKQGIKEMPLIDNECYLLDRDEFNKLHRFFSDERTITVGVLTEEPSQEIKLSIKKLFASHIGVFGNTGSGKSNTLARIFSELFNANTDKDNFKNNASFVIIDFNGEYTKEDLITKNKKSYNLTTRNSDGDKYPIKQSNIERLEIISVLLEATEKTQKPFLNRAIRNEYLEEDFENRTKANVLKTVKDILHKGDPNLSVAIFSEYFSHLRQLETNGQNVASGILNKIESGDLKYHSNSSTYYIGQYYANSDIENVILNAFPNLNTIAIDSSNLGKLKFKILSQYYHEIINGYSNQEHIRPLIGRMFKKFEMLGKLITTDNYNSADNNLEVINLKDVNLEMKKTLPLIIVKQLYDEHKEVGDFELKSLHIVIDEAHNILSSASERESETWKDYRLETFEELIKEGRKFSTFLTVSSQRPYDISPTIISQLHNYFIHRLINDLDIKAIEKTVAYLDKLSFESIPVLAVGSCFIAGLASDIPVKVDIDLLPIERQPRSETINLEKAWNDNTSQPDQEIL